VGTATPAAPYPPKARNNGVHGTVKFEIVVDANGSVVDAREISAELGDGLDASALDTVRTWKFKPATKNAVPIAVRMVVEFAFGPS
jgi:protein TonB